MEQQNQNYEYGGETFGFINSTFAETENFSLNQELDASKQNTPSLMPDFNSSTTTDYNDPSSLYSLPSEFQELSSETLNKQKSDQENSPTFNIKSDPIIETGDTTKMDNISDSIEEPNNQVGASENVDKETEKSIEEATSDLKPDDTESYETSISPSKVAENKTFKKDTHLKKRRRIVLLNDSDDENELKKELLSKTSDTEQDDKQTEKSNELDADNEADSESEKELPTNVNRNFLKAKHLLKSAVIIQGPDKKKKKKQRVLDSDDEDPIHTSIDDIGLINENENEEEEGEEMLSSDIVIINEDPFEAPAENTENSEPIPQNTEQDSKVAPNENEIVTQPVDNNIETEAKDTDKNDEQKSPKPEESKSEDIKPESPKNEKNENEEDVETILEKIQPMDDDDDFFKFNDTTDEDNVPNDKYFGTPDTSSRNTARRGRKRGPKPGTRRNTSDQKRPIRTRGSKYERDFVDDSESSSYSESISSSESSESSSSSREKVTRVQSKPTVVRKPPVAPVKTFTITKVPVKKEFDKKDRFYDKSRNIPNDVYFGDVKVPLHVLHSRWNNDGTEDRSRKIQRININKNIQRVVHIPATVTNPQTFRAHQEDESKLTVMKEFIRLSGLKINYPKLFSNVKSVEHKCLLLRRILVQKGMEGEPTIAKCKQLKREIQAKRESAELDKSVILQTEGRTRRSRRGVSSKESEDSLATSNNEGEATNVKPQILETLTKIKSVIDSDSE